MNKSVRTISMEELNSDKELWEGCLKRRQKKNAYLENPKYVHPIYGTPLMEPYKAAANPARAEHGAMTMKLQNLS